VKVEVTDSVKKIFGRVKPAEHKHLVRCLDSYRKQFEAVNRTDHQREGIAAGIHEAIDTLIVELRDRDRGNAAKVSCTKGCAHCCYTEVGITRDEALLLHCAAEEAGISIDMDRLRAQAAQPEGQWSNLDYPMRRCVFLAEDNSCGVYEHRPSACRKYLVVTPPERCDTNKHAGAEVGRFVNPEAEVLHNAALQAFKAGSMPQMLLETLPAVPPQGDGGTQHRTREAYD
jgi:Fe-S-cluster containining protein